MTLEVVSSLRTWGQLLDSTVLVSLLQPEPEVVAMFDDVILLSEGRVIWHGPPDQVTAGCWEWRGAAQLPSRRWPGSCAPRCARAELRHRRHASLLACPR